MPDKGADAIAQEDAHGRHCRHQWREPLHAQSEEEGRHREWPARYVRALQGDDELVQ